MKNQLEIIEALFPAVAQSTFGKKMFNRIAPLVESLFDANATEKMAEIHKHLSYIAGSSPQQAMVFEFLANVANNGDWREFVRVYGNLLHPYQSLKVLGDKGVADYFEPYNV
jgi:hypothetical protein